MRLQRDPDLESNENFRALQDQLEGTENRISVARTGDNEAVNRYNAYIRQFPQVLTTRAIGKAPAVPRAADAWGSGSPRGLSGGAQSSSGVSTSSQLVQCAKARSSRRRASVNSRNSFPLGRSAGASGRKRRTSLEDVK